MTGMLNALPKTPLYKRLKDAGRLAAESVGDQFVLTNIIPKGMTVAESERLFRDDGFLDSGNARQQAARGTYDPAFLNYTMGKLMIRKLRDDWSASRGGRKAWREFHDRFLAYGGPPVPMVREAMLGTTEGSLF